MIDPKNHPKSILFSLIAGIAMLLFMAQPSLAAFPVTPSAYWQLEDTTPAGSGIIDDLAVVNGACTTCPTSTAAQVDLGFDFSGSNAEVDFADNAIFDFADTASFSIELWMRIAAAPMGDRQVMVGRFETGSTFWWLSVETDGTIGAQFADSASGGTGAAVITTTAPVADDAWHHVVAVFDRTANRISIYVDGAVVGSQTLVAATDGDYLSVSAVTFGYLDVGTFFYYAGLLDNVAIYSATALSAADVAQSFAGGSGGFSLDDDYAPVFSGSRSESVALGYPASFIATASGNPLPNNYTATNLPSGASINATSGAITWFPNDMQTGNNAFTVTAENTIAPPGSQDWTVAVEDLCASNLDTYWKLEADGGPFQDSAANAANGTCTGAACPTQVAAQVGFGQSFDATDDQIDIPANAVFDWADTVSFSIELWMRIAADPGARQVMIGRFETGSTVWWLSVENGGTVGAQFADSDGGLPATINTTTDVADDAWHHVVAVLDRAAGAGGQILIYVDGALEATRNLTAVDNGNYVSTSAVNLGYLNTGGFFRYGGSLDEVATYNIALSDNIVAQHFNAAAGQSYCNDAPTITSTSVDTATQGVAYSYSAEATDPETHDIAWSLTTNPAGMAIDANTGVVSWTPDNSATASEDVVIMATDEFGATATQAFTITVTLVDNNAPVITTTGPTTATVGTAYTYAAAATDADTGDTLTWSLAAGFPTGMAVDPATGAVTWTPDATGDFTYTLNVTDNIDTDSETVTVTVSAASSGGGGGGGGGCFITSLY